MEAVAPKFLLVLDPSILHCVVTVTVTVVTVRLLNLLHIIMAIRRYVIACAVPPAVRL